MPVFVSYSHKDKSLALRIERRLKAFGVETLRDENDFQRGSTLPKEVERNIDRSTHMIVIASDAAAGSEYVKAELDYAYRKSRNTAMPIFPLFIDDVEKNINFDSKLGISFKKKWLIDGLIYELAILLGGRNPSPDHEELLFGLKQLTREVPALAPVIQFAVEKVPLPFYTLGCLSDDTIDFHDLEFALTSAYDVASPEDRPTVAEIAAYAFSHRGAGSEVLLRDIEAQSKNLPSSSGRALSKAISRQLAFHALDAAVLLLERCSVPNDEALSKFISSNYFQWKSYHKRDVVRLVTWPVRGPEGFAMDAALESYIRMPESRDLRELWIFWVRSGFFERNDELLRRLFKDPMLEDGALPSIWEPIFSEVYIRVRYLARKPSRESVITAVMYLVSAKASTFPSLDRIVRELEGAISSAEWKDWEHGEDMGVFILMHCDEAMSEGKWARARQKYEDWQRNKHFS